MDMDLIGSVKVVSKSKKSFPFFVQPRTSFPEAVNTLSLIVPEKESVQIEVEIFVPKKSPDFNAFMQLQFALFTALNGTQGQTINISRAFQLGYNYLLSFSGLRNFFEKRLNVGSRLNFAGSIYKPQGIHMYAHMLVWTEVLVCLGLIPLLSMHGERGGFSTNNTALKRAASTTDTIK